ncbi:hypothetical protein MMC13_004092 [Lambiella insularis]|nr:hypothetical protein [Lambiella insularis]
MPYIEDQSPVSFNHIRHPHKMGLFSSLRSKLNRKNTGLSATSSTTSSRSPPSTMSGKNPFSAFTAPPPSYHTSPNVSFISTPYGTTPSGTTPTRRPPPPEAPPAYQASITTASNGETSFLSMFDFNVMIDDSGSMAGRSWRETRDALMAIAPVITEQDTDGIDIYFFNYPDHPSHHNVTTAAQVESIFRKVQPLGGTPTGTRLHSILKPYLKGCEAKGVDNVKPLNLIVITDGVPSDDPEAVIFAAAKKLDKWDAPPWQVGIQFFQVGNEPGAAERLREMDDELGGGMVRDMVDTVPWNGESGPALGKVVWKAACGAIDRRMDRKKLSLELRR